MDARTDTQIGRTVARMVDVTIAALALLLLFPLFALISMAVLIECGRPIFFRQTRLGLGGTHFEIIKFRKFTTRETRAGLPLTMKNDSRMSRVGGFLARTKLDELPQLINVLRGEMAIVGPRPESLDFADCFDNGYRCVLNYRPGILGPSQAIFRDEWSLYPEDSNPTAFYREVLFPRKASVDRSYYSQRTLISDLKWMLFGALAVFGVAFDMASNQEEDQPSRVPIASGSADVIPITARVRQTRRPVLLSKLVLSGHAPKQKAN